MDFKLLVTELNKLKLPRDQYIVVGSGSMAAHGIREANNLDILVREDLWTELAKKYQVRRFGEIENINLGNIQIMGHGSMYLKSEIASIDEMIKTADTIEGHKFLKLELLRKFKEKEGRDKDVIDLALIEEYLTQE